MDTANKIIALLQHNTASGQRESEVFEDWLQLIEASLDALPAHVRAAAATHQPAEDTPEVKALWARCNGRYPQRDYFERFSEAFGLLLNSTTGPEKEPVYMDLIGQVFMEFGRPSAWKGQFFTPWHVARLMAQMTGNAEAEVHKRIEAAISKSPAAQGLLLGCLCIEDADLSFSFYLNHVIPACIEHYEPVTVCDPCVGSGVMLLAHASTLPPWMVQMGLVRYHGMDIDATCVRMARINCKLYGLNGEGLRWYIELSAAEIKALPLPYSDAYADAQESAVNGFESRVDEIAEELSDLSQLRLFSEVMAT